MSGDTLDLSTFETIVRLAEQFGPFLFAILFLLVITRTAHSYYQECNTRKHPAASEQEKKTYRTYFICSMWSGIVVMALSIGWWVYAQSRGTNTYQVAIVDLKDDETVLADYFYRKVPRPTISGAATIHDDYFLIVQDQPFQIGEKLKFDFFKAHPSSTPNGGILGTRLEIKYEGKKQDTYRLTLDAGTPALTAVAQDDSAADRFLTAGEIKALGPQLARSFPAPAGEAAAR